MLILVQRNSSGAQKTLTNHFVIAEITVLVEPDVREPTFLGLSLFMKFIVIKKTKQVILLKQNY